MVLLPGMNIEANKETISVVDKTSWCNIQRPCRTEEV
jgi:hypothetical protein